MNTFEYALEPHENQSPSLKQSVGYSVIAHFIVLIIFTVKTVFFTGEPLMYESAVKVDLVAMPDKLDLSKPMPELEEPAAKAPVETPVKPEAQPTPVAEPQKLNPKIEKKEIDHESINLEAAKKKQSAALEKLKQLSALEAIEKDVSDDNKKKANEKAAEKPKPIKGNVLSSGSELTGVSRLQHDNYISTVERHIRQNWALPEWLARKSLKAQIRVRFDENGNVISRDIYKSSGNPSFDEVVMTTIEKSSPVPAPPPKFVRILSIEGILLGFPE